MGKLTAEHKVREYNRGQKAAREGRSRSWSTHSNPINIMKNAERRSTRAME